METLLIVCLSFYVVCLPAIFIHITKDWYLN